VILDTVEKYPRKDLKDVTIETLNRCINITANVLTLLNRPGDEEVREKMKALLCNYVRMLKPSVWMTQFEGAHTIALFIKYMSREDLSKAFRKFSEVNHGNQHFTMILDELQNIFTEPIVTPDQLDQIMKLGDNRTEAVNNLLESIKTKQYRSPLLKFFSDLSADWMKFMHASPLALPLPPRNAQLITALACVQWASSSSVSRGSALIGQVGTGEGKSLIIAMLAIYFAKVLKKKVHIMENNSTLLAKDFAQFEDFYESQNVTVTKYFANQDADVTYCLRYDPKGDHQDLDTFYREKVFSGEEPFKNTYLIVDEVDELIVDSKPNVSYVKEVTNTGPMLIECFDALRDGGKRPPNIPEYIWREAEDGYSRASSKVKDIDYAQHGNNIYPKTGSKVDYRGSASWVQYLEYTLLGKRDITVRTDFYYQCMPHLISQYGRIIGLSGAIGSASEMKFLERTYKAKKFLSPSFLDTCKNSQKSPPTLIGDHVQVCPIRRDQIQAVIDMALLKFREVPVIIICESDSNAISIRDKLIEKLNDSSKKHLPTGMHSSDVVQLFLETDPATHEKMPSVEIIEKATSPCLSRLCY